MRYKSSYMENKSDVVIIADWGNTNGRLYCIEGNSLTPKVLERTRIPGVKNLQDASSVFFNAANNWIDKYSIGQAFFCGAITSNIGWHTTGYNEVPSSVENMFSKSRMLRNGFEGHFLSGVSTKKNSDVSFNTARGEDVLVYGLMGLTGLKNGIICTPGTHPNWFAIENGKITNLLTGVAGEAFYILNNFTMMTEGHEETSCETAEFLMGLRAMSQKPRPSLMHILTSVKTLQLSGILTSASASDYLSGLIVGEDCSAAMDLFKDPYIWVISDPNKINPYHKAIEYLGRTVIPHDSEDCVIAGVQQFRDHFG